MDEEKLANAFLVAVGQDGWELTEDKVAIWCQLWNASQQGRRWAAELPEAVGDLCWLGWRVAELLQAPDLAREIVAFYFRFNGRSLTEPMTDAVLISHYVCVLLLDHRLEEADRVVKQLLDTDDRRLISTRRRLLQAVFLDTLLRKSTDWVLPNALRESLCKLGIAFNRKPRTIAKTAGEGVEFLLSLQWVNFGLDAPRPIAGFDWLHTTCKGTAAVEHSV